MEHNASFERNHINEEMYSLNCENRKNVFRDLSELSGYQKSSTEKLYNNRDLINLMII